jgi:hypothetical protein
MSYIRFIISSSRIPSISSSYLMIPRIHHTYRMHNHSLHECSSYYNRVLHCAKSHHHLHNSHVLINTTLMSQFFSILIVDKTWPYRRRRGATGTQCLCRVVDVVSLPEFCTWSRFFCRSWSVANVRPFGTAAHGEMRSKSVPIKIGSRVRSRQPASVNQMFAHSRPVNDRCNNYLRFH